MGKDVNNDHLVYHATFVEEKWTLRVATAVHHGYRSTII